MLYICVVNVTKHITPSNMIIHYMLEGKSEFIFVMDGTCILFGLTQIGFKDVNGQHHDIKFVDIVSIGK